MTTGIDVRPSGVQVIGRIENGSVRVSLWAPSGGGAVGVVSSVFGRTGAVTALLATTRGAGYWGGGGCGGGASGGCGDDYGSKTVREHSYIEWESECGGEHCADGDGADAVVGSWSGRGPRYGAGRMTFSLGVGSDNLFHCSWLVGDLACRLGAELARYSGGRGRWRRRRGTIRWAD